MCVLFLIFWKRSSQYFTYWVGSWIVIVFLLLLKMYWRFSPRLIHLFWALRSKSNLSAGFLHFFLWKIYLQSSQSHPLTSLSLKWNVSLFSLKSVAKSSFLKITFYYPFEKRGLKDPFLFLFSKHIKINTNKTLISKTAFVNTSICLLSSSAYLSPGSRRYYFWQLTVLSKRYRYWRGNKYLCFCVVKVTEVETMHFTIQKSLLWLVEK